MHGRRTVKRTGFSWWPRPSGARRLRSLSSGFPDAYADYSVTAAWQVNRLDPLERGEGARKGSGLGARCPEAYATSGLDAPRGLRHQLRQVSDGAAGGSVETRSASFTRILLQPVRQDLSELPSQRPRHLFQQRSLLRVRFEQSYGELRIADLECQARKACAAANVEQPTLKFDPTGNIEAFPEVPRETFLRRTDSAQVDFLVPAEEKVEVLKRLA